MMTTTEQRAQVWRLLEASDPGFESDYPVMAFVLADGKRELRLHSAEGLYLRPDDLAGAAVVAGFNALPGLLHDLDEAEKKLQVAVKALREARSHLDYHMGDTDPFVADGECPPGDLTAMQIMSKALSRIE